MSLKKDILFDKFYKKILNIHKCNIFFFVSRKIIKKHINIIVEIILKFFIRKKI